jgi:hypothetical protein
LTSTATLDAAAIPAMPITPTALPITAFISGIFMFVPFFLSVVVLLRAPAFTVQKKPVCRIW